MPTAQDVRAGVVCPTFLAFLRTVFSPSFFFLLRICLRLIFRRRGVKCNLMQRVKVVFHPACANFATAAYVSL